MKHVPSWSLFIVLLSVGTLLGQENPAAPPAGAEAEGNNEAERFARFAAYQLARLL